MNYEAYIPYVSVAVTVAAVVYAYVTKKNLGDVVTTVKDAVAEGVQAHAEIAAQIQAPLEAAVAQLPKTRSKRNRDVTVDVEPEPPSAA